MGARWLLVACVVLVGCDGEGETAAPPPHGACSAGELAREDGSCQPAGVPADMACPPGEWLSDAMECVPAGVPHDGCGAGFVHTGDRGCDVVLPESPCAAGFVALPGEARCRELAPCGTGTFGDIPVRSDNEYVDASYTVGDSDGSMQKPWPSIQAGVDAAVGSAIVAVAAGSYVEDVEIGGKPVRLMGRCPALTEIVGTGGALAALDIVPGATGTEVRGLAVRGESIGVGASGVQDIVIDSVWVHDNASVGMLLDDGFSPPSITLRNSLIENNRLMGMQVSGADLLVEATVIRDNQASAAGEGGRGLNAEHSYTDANAPTNVTIRGAVIERNRDCGVCGFGSNLVVEDTAILGTESTVGGVHGRGINLQPSTGTGDPSTLSVVRSVIAGSHDTGIFASGESTVEYTVVRLTMTDAHGAFGRGVLAQVGNGMTFSLSLVKSLIEDNVDTGLLILGAQATVGATAVRRSTVGRGIGVQTERVSGITAKLSLTTSLSDDNAVEGIYMAGGEATIDASVVRATRPDVVGNFGRGLGIQGDATTGAPSTFVMSRSLVDQNYEAGMFLSGALATIESSALIMPPNGHPLGAPGIAMNPLADWGVPSTVTIRSTLVEASSQTALDVLSSAATIEGSIVRNTRARPLDGLFGDSLFIDSQTSPATAKLIATRFEHGARSALLSWGGHVMLERSQFVCHAFDFDAGTSKLGAARFEDLGGNGCGCPEPAGTCKSVTTGIAPPGPLPPTVEDSM